MLFGEGQIPAGRERLEVDLDTRERNFQESWLGQLIRREFYLDELVPARPDMYRGQEYMFHRLVNWQWLAEAAKIVRRFTGTFFDEDQLHQFAEQYGAKGSSLNAFIPSREPDDGGYGAEAVELKKTGSDAPLADVIVASRGQEYGPNLRLHWIRQELRYLGGQLVLPWELHLYAEAVNTKVEFKDAPHGPFKLERWLSKEERNNEKLHWQRLRAWGTINLEMAELLYNGLLQKM